MKFFDWAVIIGTLIATGAFMLLIMAIAMLPYVAVLVIALACARYLGWF